MKRIYTLAFLFFVVMGLSAQTMFQRTSGSVSNDRNYHLTAMAGGSLFATGYTEAVAGNLTDAFLVKYNRFGVVEWAKTYGQTGDENNWDVIVTQNFQIVGVGYSSDLSTYEGGIISRIDTFGNVIWSTGVVSSAGNVNFYRVIETSDGHLVATGLISINNQDDILLCKFTSSGTLLWSRIIKTPQDDEMMGLIETTQGDYLMAGLTNDITGNGGSEFAVVKTDTAGNVLWKKRYGGIGSDRLNDVVEHNLEYYFLGWSSATGIGGNDVVVMKTDTLGNLLWINAYGTPQADRAFNMLYDSFQNCLVVAGYTDYSDSVTNNRNTFLMSIGLNGTINWAKSYGSTGTDGHWPTGLAMNDDQGYYVLGSTNTFGPGNYSIYLTKTDFDGNTACHQKNPQFTMQLESGFNAINFGTDSTIILMGVPITISGVPWILTSSQQCCSLHNDAGPDWAICPDHLAQVGQGSVPGYVYSWLSNGNPVGNQPFHQVVWSDAGTYILSVSAPNTGCVAEHDTVVVSQLQAPPKPTFTVTGNDLTSSATDGNQWYLYQQPIPGATQQTLTILQDGIYHVEVTNIDGCVSVSDSSYVTHTGMDELLGASLVYFYPNPAGRQLHVVFGSVSADVRVYVYDLHGRVVLTAAFDQIAAGQTETLEVSALPPGVYHLSVLADNLYYRSLFVTSGR